MINPLLAFWFTPFFYAGMTLAGQVAYRLRRKRLGRRKKLAKVVFQIPTIGNIEECNTILEKVRSYGLPVQLETWVIIDARHYRVGMQFNCDRLVIVPEDFKTGCLFKSRSLEYARRLRLAEGYRDYIVIQCDDDSTPSREFMLEAIEVDADVMIGTIAPRPLGHLLPDYERPVACGMSCLFFTNIGVPIWGHGEGMVISERAEKLVSYEPRGGQYLISSEDLFYLHRASYVSYAEDQYYVQKARSEGLKIYASPKRVFITPPLNMRDALRQRRRWLWGHLRLIRGGMLPWRSLVMVGLAESLGLVVYAGATALAILTPFGVIRLQPHELVLSYLSLALWFSFRGFNIGGAMGLWHGLRGALLSFVTVTLNFIYHLAGLLMGDPRRFEVIKKYVPKVEEYKYEKR
jgi:hypothetical protein